MNEFLTGILWITLTVASYVFSRKLYQRFPSPLLVPVFTSTFLLVLLLLIFNIEYETFMIGAGYIDKLLGPAIVALALPLYKQREMVKKYFASIGIGVLVGTITGLWSGFTLVSLLGFEPLIARSALPKSVTTPVAMEIARTVSGEPSLAVVFVMIAGIGGVMVGPFLMRGLKIDHFVGVGIGLGCASHAIGTSKALEFGEKAAAVSSIAMTLSAVCASILAPLMMTWLL
ncbi:LrgB family protein [Pseudalkalibacillus caeni]|uniref:LrgB family protein n=1 Tax=Exobacillus caeni TaxID=2574798 RepID=A0A5R9F677_9BACL|nr:LrgB family protein [Pseudalkalibacillus caeni]TLS39057.1 LrgB family protein [Pseudalkalibacillus caeni]